MLRRKSLLLTTVLAGSGAPASQVYAAKVTATAPLRHNKLNETSGTAIVDSTANAFTGTYNGVTLASADSPFLPDKAASWDGVNDYGNIYSAAFNTAFTPSLFSVMIWVKVDAAFWADATSRRFLNIEVNGSNTIIIFKSAANTLRWLYTAGGTTAARNKTYSNTNWFAVGMTVDLANNRMRPYVEGVQEGANIAVGTWAGALNSARVVLGAGDTSAVQPHSGLLSNFIVWTRELTAAEMLSLAS